PANCRLLTAALSGWCRAFAAAGIHVVHDAYQFLALVRRQNLANFEEKLDSLSRHRAPELVHFILLRENLLLIRVRLQLQQFQFFHQRDQTLAAHALGVFEFLRQLQDLLFLILIDSRHLVQRKRIFLLSTGWAALRKGSTAAARE